MSAKGQNKEKRVSLLFQNHPGVLVSPMLLRRLGAGQIDYCFIQQETLMIVEAKSSLTGATSFQKVQKGRLGRSATFLSALTGLGCKILLV